MTDTPAWFATEILRKLSGVNRGLDPGQFYAHCPAHDDRHSSFGIKPGDKMTVVYYCQKGCTSEEMRAALVALGIPEERLGQYGTPEYEHRRRARMSGTDRQELEVARREAQAAKRALAELRGDIKALLLSGHSLAVLKVRILATVDDVDIPADRKGYVAFAKKAGVSQPRAYVAWDSDPLGRARVECITKDHVVLTQPDENCQASQVDSNPRILEPRKAGGEPSRTENPDRAENSRTEKTSDRRPAVRPERKRRPAA